MAALTKKQKAAKKAWETRRKNLEKSAAFDASIKMDTDIGAEQDPQNMYDALSETLSVPTGLGKIAVLDNDGAIHKRFHSYNVDISNENDEVLGTCIVRAQTKHEAIRLAQGQLVFTAYHNKY
jgi:hypothetical protein